MTMACRGDQNCVSHVCEQEEEWDEISLHASGAACTADDPQQQQQQHCTTPTLPYPLERLTAATLVATAQTKEGPAYTGEYGTGQRADSSDDGTLPQEGVGGDQTGRSGSRSPLSRGQDQVRMVEDLLFEIYLNRYRASGRRDSFDSDGYSISSCTSDALPGRSSEYERSNPVRLKRACMETTDIEDLRQMVEKLDHRIQVFNVALVRQLRVRERRLARQTRQCDVLTATLQAMSGKTREDTRIRFSVEPTAGEEGFQQWKHALKAVARLPMGIPHEFRRKIWLRLAEDHIRESKLDWEKTKRVCFNERSNPDDNKLGRQIVKDLHRTGWNGFSGQEAEDDRATLKRVLLAYARFNKAVGYCQGFNVLAGLILDVVERKEDDALKIMIFVIGHVLPQSYFSNNLRALSVDMAVFRDLLRLKLPQLARHLDHLQDAAKDSNGSHYEPPLTNVFTMQWFLTLFATCLQKSTVLRVWDSILLEGSEVILRTALAIWGKLSPRIQGVDSADQFYGTMGLLMQEMLELNMIDCKDLLAEIYSMAPFPFPEVTELREKYTYNITPLHSTAKRVNIFSDDETEMTEDDMAATIGCFTGMIPPTQTTLPRPRADDGHILDIQSVTPGALSPQPDMGSPWQQSTLERTTMDITTLRKQYGKLRERQAQAQIILAGAHAQRKPARERHQHQRAPPTGTFPPMTGAPIIINHLYLSNSSGGRGRGVRGGRGGAANPCHGVRTMQPSQRDRHGLVEARNGTQADVSTPAHACADVPSQGDRHGLVEARNGTQADVGAPAYATADFPSQDGETEDSVKEGENSRRGGDDDDDVQRTRSATCPAAVELPSDDGEATAASEGVGGWGGGAAAGLANVKPRRTTSMSICEPLSSQRPTTKSTHYPFPRRHSLQRSNVCMQLGMYGHRAGVVGAGVACGGDPSSRHGGDAAEPGVTEIKASHINQCLHRQYMAQIKVERN